MVNTLDLKTTLESFLKQGLKNVSERLEFLQKMGEYEISIEDAINDTHTKKFNPFNKIEKLHTLHWKNIATGYSF